MRRWIAIACCALAVEAGVICFDGGNSPAWSQTPVSPGPANSTANSAANSAASPAAARPGNAAGGTELSAGSLATEKLLKNVRSLIQQHQFRSAEQRLLARIAASPQSSPATLEELLGEVYFQSGQAAKAITALTRSLAAYQQIPRPSLAALRDESRAACLLADVYSRQGQPAKAVDALKQMLAHYNRTDTVDAPTELDLVSRLGELVWSQPGFGQSGLGESTAALDAEIDWLAKRLQADRTRLSDDALAQGLVCLAKYQTASAHYDQAIRTLRQLIAWWGANRDASVLLEVRLQMAQIYRKQQDFKAEIASLSEASGQAHRLERSTSPTARGVHVQLSYELAKIEQLLADAFIHEGQTSQAAEELGLAFQDFRSAHDQSALRSPEDAEIADLSDIPLLERIVEVGDRLVEVQGGGSVSLVDNISLHDALAERYQKALLPNDPRLGRLEVSLGGLYLENSQFDAARDKLSQAREFWSQYRPQNAPLLVQTLNLLVECDLAIGSLERLREADGALVEAVRLAEQLPAGDDLRWWVRLNRGRLQAAQGHYQQALDEFGRIVAGAPPPAVNAANSHRIPTRIESLALLQLGLLYKEQLEFDQSLEYCRRALSVRDAELSANSPERLDYYLALGELYAARNDSLLHDDQSLADVVERANAVCSHLPEVHPARAAVLHLQAMAHYLSDERKSDAGQRQSARAIWTQLVALCRRTGQVAMEARAMHYLARLDFLDWTAELKAWSEKLRSINSAANDASIKNLKGRILDYNSRQVKLALSRTEYRQSVDAYHQLAGEPYETQHSAYEALQKKLAAIEREQKALGELNAALAKERETVLKAHDDQQSGRDSVDPADRSRWQQLLIHGESLEEQSIAKLRSTGVYPSLQHAALCTEAQLLQAESQLDTGRPQLLERALAALEEATAVIEDPRAATFAGDFMRAEFFSQYQSAFDLQVEFRVQAGQFAEAIVAAEQGRSRTLLDQLWSNNVHHDFSAAKAAAIIARWRTSDEPLLYYYVGNTASYLFVLGGSQHAIQSFPLKAAAGTSAAGLGNNAPSRYVAAMVERLRDNFRDERSSRQVLSDPADTASLAEASAVLMPPAVVDYLRREAARGAACVTIVPHKAISQLPLEALIVGPDDHRGYLTDCAPPIVYVPSLDVLDDLEQRPALAAGGPKLLTLGDPDFTNANARLLPGDPRLAPLPESAAECREIAANFAAQFGATSVVSLLHADASEGRFRDALSSNRFTFIHLATHGIVGVERGEPFGRIVLTPPSAPSGTANRSANDDGFLDLAEIRRLDLHGCELVALSACNTNAGTVVGGVANRPASDSKSAAARNAARLSQVDTCFSLASAFLAAGSRRVLATQWEVADPSTRAFMVALFDEIDRAASADQPINYARLLAAARHKLRTAHPEFDTPFHWAPFVLIGPR